MAATNISNLLSNNLAGNSQSINGPIQIYLMGGEVPIDENGYYPKNFTVTYPKVGDYWPPNTDMPSLIEGLTSGTYTASVTDGGQVITAAVDVANGIANNFRITNRTGNNGFGPGLALAFPFQIPSIINSFGQESPSYIDLEAFVDNGSTTLVNWKNNRITISNNIISTHAAIATSSGTATWFYAYNSGGGSYYGAYIVGTVGATSSGADLELGNVNIVQGKTYGINNLRIQMPTSFTY